MHVTSLSIENGGFDLAQIVFKMLVTIAKKRFLRKKMIGNLPEKQEIGMSKIQQWRHLSGKN